MVFKDLADSPPPFPPEEHPEPLTGPEEGDVQRTFHPYSRLPSQIQSFDDYLLSESLTDCDKVPPEEQPWKPFRTQLDFEVAEFIEENMLNKRSTEKLIQLLRRVAANINDFTIRNQADLDKQWDLASKKCTNVS